MRLININNNNYKKKEIDVKEDTINKYKPEKINGVFNDKYIEYESKDDNNLSIEE